MILNSLIESAEKGELILIENGFCRFYRKRNKIVTIREILSLSPGLGSKMLQMVIDKNPQAIGILARCPKDWKANNWYEKKGFSLSKAEGNINIWYLEIKSYV